MSLSCGCDYGDWDYDAGDWVYWYLGIEDFVPLNTTRRKRCCSCAKLIDIGSLCVIYPRYRYPYDEIEAMIKTGNCLDTSLNDEPCIKIAPHYHCEKCGEIWMNLVDIGYECLSPKENMRENLKEYHELSGFNKEVK